MTEPVAVVDDARFDAHEDPFGSHPERPQRLAAAREGLYSGLDPAGIVTVSARHAESPELSRVHRPEYLAAVRSTLGQGAGRLDPDTFFNAATGDAAWLAAGGAVAMVDTLRSADGPTRGFALLRPPGHHAEPSRSMGFCILNNVAIAAAGARAAGLSRVAIVDFDVHHGNGTQWAFYQDPQVLFVSLHQDRLYPGTGGPEETGEGQGRGTTINVALPAGSGSAAYSAAMRRIVVPALERFAPDLVLVSAGFDAHGRDPLAQMQLDAPSYQAMASALIRVADRHCNGRIGFLLEGGYDLVALRDSVAGVARALAAQFTELDDDPPTPLERAAITATEQYLRGTPMAIGDTTE